ncbi:MAG: extracellular solute-binding protein [Treponema sp.]|jgi:raffinose/stachyose/melibiose transport system substrate-binding protein|nr:extracellular solute-binding protein [Treponema sp.]
MIIKKINELIRGASGLAALICLITLFSGCTADDDKPVELRVLNYFDTTAASSKDEVSFVWETFEKTNPDIKIIREDLFNTPFHERVEAYLAAGELPDVMYVWPSGRSAQLHTRNLFKNLEPLIKRDKLDQQFTSVALDPGGQISNRIGILPRTITASSAFYVNLDILDECALAPARTYEELKAQVPVLAANGYKTVLMANEDSWVMQSCLFSLVAGRFCGQGWTQRILSGKAKFTDADFVDALAFIKTIYDDGVISRDSLSTSYPDVTVQFADGRAPYFIDGDWRVAAFVTDQTTGRVLISPERQKNFFITVFPDIPAAKINKSSSVVLGTGFGINAAIKKGSAREAAAWKLVKWLSGAEVQSWLLRTGGIATPTRNDINVAALNLEPMQIAAGNLSKEYDKSTPVIDGAFEKDVYDPINEGLRDIGLGTRTPRQVAEAVQAAFEGWRRD